MKIEYNVTSIPESKRGDNAKYTIILKEFNACASESMVFKFDNVKEARSCYTSVWAFRHRNNLEWDFHMRGNNVYVVKRKERK